MKVFELVVENYILGNITFFLDLIFFIKIFSDENQLW